MTQYTHTHIHMCGHTLTHIYTHTHTHAHTHTHTHGHTHGHMDTHTHTHTWAHTHTHMGTHTHTHTHTRMDTCTHTHTHTHTALECDQLPDISNGRVIITSPAVGSTARYVCDPGFQLVGRATRTCQADGKWSGEEPFCRGEADNRWLWLYVVLSGHL